MSQPEIESFTFRRTRTRVYDSQNDPNALLTSLLDIICPAGTIISTLAAEEPGEGWKLCDGQALSKIAFPRLYAIIGGAFGEDADTFNLPDLRGRMPFGAANDAQLFTLGGAASVELTIANLPPHSHGVTDPGHTHAAPELQANNAATGTGRNSVAAGSSGSATTGITIENTGSGEPVPILPPYIAVNWMVRT
jgi:microcystin-dependent protein